MARECLPDCPTIRKSHNTVASALRIPMPLPKDEGSGFDRAIKAAHTVHTVHKASKGDRALSRLMTIVEESYSCSGPQAHEETREIASLFRRPTSERPARTKEVVVTICPRTHDQEECDKPN